MTAPGFAARRGYFALASSLLVVDQITKAVAHHYLSERAALQIIPGFFSFWYSRNPGGLFGSFRDWGAPLRFVLLTVLPLIAVGFISVYLTRTRAVDRPTLLGLAFILGGAVGNLIDRIIRGEVIDFLDVYVSSPKLADWLVQQFGTAHWPTFNVADSSIVVGAGLLLVSIVRPQHSPARITPG